MTRATILSRSLFIAWLSVGLAGCATSGHTSRRDQEEIAGKTFVITGASSGFGRGVALKLAASHANVVLAARRTQLLNEVATEVQSLGGTALVVATDVTDAEQMKHLAAATVERFGRIDVWINNSGVGAIGPFEEIPMEDHSRLTDINFKGVIFGSHVAMKQFRLQKFGTLVNIGSIDSEVPLAYQASYAATKAGVLSLGRTLNEEIRLSGAKRIRVATVMPWAADTPWWNHAANYSGHAPRMEAMDDPQKVVNAIVWVSLHPKEELAVGWKAKMAYVSHHLMPDLTERLSADISRKEQMEKGAETSPTKGTLYTPLESGTQVDGGVRARMRQEDENRK
jgi:short-subunit dehydrogenase